MAVRQIADKMSSGELLDIYLGGTDPEHKVAVTGDITPKLESPVSDGKLYGQLDAAWEATDLHHLTWKNEWSPGEYNQNDVVRDGDWTMVANKITSDPPAPEPVGNPTNLLPVSPVWTAESYAGAAVSSGIRVYGIPSTYQIGQFKAWIPDTSLGTAYRITMLNNLTGERSSTPLYQGNSFSNVGWHNLIVNPVWITPNSDYTFVLVSGKSTASSTFDYPWNWLAESNPEQDPTSGNVRANKQHNTLRISSTDANAVNRAPQLAQAMVMGTTIKVEQSDNANKWSEFEVVDWVDHGTYVTFSMINTGIGSTGSPDDAALCDVYFDIPVPLEVSYVRNVDGFLDKPNAYGFLQLDQNSPVEYANDAFGLDVYIQEFVASADWDLLSFSGVGSGEVSSAPNPTLTYNLLKSNSIVVTGDVYETIGELITEVLPSGTYEYKFSWVWDIDSVTNSAYLRYSINGGANWNELRREAKDVTDEMSEAYFFPIVEAEGIKQLQIQARKENAGDVYNIRFLDLIIQRVR